MMMVLLMMFNDLVVVMCGRVSGLVSWDGSVGMVGKWMVG